MELYWIKPEGQALLSEFVHMFLAAEKDVELVIMELKRRYKHKDAATLNSGIEIALARIKAKYSAYPEELVTQGLLTRRMLEQSSNPLTSSLRKKRFRGRKHVIEIGTGVGFDTSAISQVAESVTSIEADMLVAEYAKWNMSVLQANNVKIICGDALQIIKTLDLNDFDACWCDPSRRDEQGNRVFDPQAYVPDLDSIFKLVGKKYLGVKVSPGLRIDATKLNCKREFLGTRTECVEQILWFNTDMLDGTVTILEPEIEWIPTDDIKSVQAKSLITVEEILAGYYLVEPHAALIRSGKLANYYLQNNIALLDDKIAYGISREKLTSNVLQRQFRIIEHFAFNLNKINQRVKSLRWNRHSEIKKRGFPEEADQLRGKIDFIEVSPDSQTGVVIIARIGKEHRVFLAQRSD